MKSAQTRQFSSVTSEPGVWGNNVFLFCCLASVLSTIYLMALKPDSGYTECFVGIMNKSPYHPPPPTTTTYQTATTHYHPPTRSHLPPPPPPALAPPCNRYYCMHTKELNRFVPNSYFLTDKRPARRMNIFLDNFTFQKETAGLDLVHCVLIMFIDRTPSPVPAIINWFRKLYQQPS